MNLHQALQTISRVRYPGFKFAIQGDFEAGKVTYLRATFQAVDAEFPAALMEQKTRKWLLSAFMTDAELVQTALKCVMTAVEHEVREHFRYKGEAIFHPHYDLDTLVQACRDKRMQVREEHPG